MSPEDRKRLEAIQSTLVSEGWSYLIEDIETKTEAMKNEFLNPQVTLELLRFGQGRISVYKELMGLRTVIEQLLEEADNEAEFDENV